MLTRIFRYSIKKSNICIRKLSQEHSLTHGKGRRVVVLDGVRTPFCIQGHELWQMEAHELGAAVMKGVIEKNNLKTGDVESCIFGSMIQDSDHHNVARDAMLYAGFPATIPSYTTSMGCTSSLIALISAYDSITAGSQNCVLVGGVEMLSNAPVLLSKSRRKALVKLSRDKSTIKYITDVFTNYTNFYIDEPPQIIDPVSGKSPLEYASDLYQMIFEVPVVGSLLNHFTTQSYLKADEARQKGLLSDVIPLYTKDGKFIESDCYDKLLMNYRHLLNRPIEYPNDKVMSFSEPERAKYSVYNSTEITKFETVAPLSDGAAASIVMNEEQALAKGLKPKAFIKDYQIMAKDIKLDAQFGVIETIAKILHKNNLNVEDIDVFELHESTAAEAVSNIIMLSDTFNISLPFKFKSNHSGARRGIGSRFNLWGGSLAIGDPFGATGVRLVTTAVNRLVHGDGKYALVISGSQGGMGVCILLERFSNE